MGKKGAPLQPTASSSFFSFDFIGWRNLAFVISGGSVVILWIWVFATGGLQYGIDFTGGIRHIFKFDRPSTPELLSEVREAATRADPSAMVQNIGKPVEGEVVIQVKGFELVEKATAEVKREPLKDLADLKTRLAGFTLFDTGFYESIQMETGLPSQGRIVKAISDYVNDATAGRLIIELERRFAGSDRPAGAVNLNKIPTPKKMFEDLQILALRKLAGDLLAKMPEARSMDDLTPILKKAGLDPKIFGGKFLLRAPQLEEIKTDLHAYAGNPENLVEELRLMYPAAFLEAFMPAAERIISEKERAGLLRSIDDAAKFASGPQSDLLKELLNGSFYAGHFVLIKTDQVSSRIGAELREKALVVISLSLLAMLIYVWIRFEFRFGVGAVVTLLHDSLTVIPIMSVLGYEYDINLIAAILTIIGYSLNDTIVVYDRIRENIAGMRGASLKDIINTSIFQTLSRTVVTGVTSLLAVLALFFFGGPVLEGFSLALFIGIVVGTYSSIFVSSPVVYLWPTKN